MIDPRDRWGMAAMPLSFRMLLLTALGWFGFAVGSAVTGHLVLAELFAAVGVLMIMMARRLRGRFWRRMKSKYPGQ